MKNEREEIGKFLNQYGRLQAVLKYVNFHTLKMAYEKVMECGAGNICMEYGENLDMNLNKLLKHMKNFSFFPQSLKKRYTSNNDIQEHKYNFPAFEEEIVRYVFKEILDAIFDFEIEEILPRITWPKSGRNTKRVVIIARAWLTISTKSIQENMDTECLLSFLKRYIDDRKFIEYVRRFISREGQTNLESELSNVNTSMLNSVYIYYILKDVIAIGDCHLTGKMWMKKDAEGLQLMFTFPEDARAVYLRILKRLKKLEFAAETSICTLSFLSNKAKYQEKYHKSAFGKHRCIVYKRRK